MNCKKTCCGIALGIMLIFMFVYTVSALTASIGNGRMVIRAAPGESVEKYVLVKNVNDVSVKINMNVSGDLEKSITLKDNGFILEKGEEKKAYFTIKADKEGTFESQISVAFSSLSEEGKKTGVGLHSTVILISSGKEIDNANITETGEEEEAITAIDSLKDKLLKLTENSGEEKKSSSGIILLLFSTIILVVLLGFFIFLMKRKAQGSASLKHGGKQGRKR